MDQAQCPNCGGYKVYTQVSFVNPKTGAKVEKLGAGYWALVALFGCGFLFGLALAAEGRLDSMAGQMLLSSFLFLLFLGWIYIKFVRTDKIERYDNHCLLCGYRWSRRADEPLPEVRVQPELIALGEQQLEEKRRQREAAEAAHYLWQQQHKK